MSLENQKKKEKNLENEDKILSDNNYLVEESLIKFKEARSFSDFICMCVIAELNHNNYKNLSNNDNTSKEDWNDFDFILSQIKDGKLEIKLENGKLKFDIDYDKQEVKSSLLDLNDNLVYTRTYPYKQINMEQEKDTSKQVENQNNKLEQKYEEFDDYGNLYKEGQFKNGLKEGIWKTYYDNSYDIENYHNGKLNGEFKKFSKDNHLLVKGEYKEHKKEGVWIDYESSEFLLFKNDILLEISSQEFKQKEEINTDSPLIPEKNEVINNNNDKNTSNTKEFLTEKSGFLASLKNFFNKNTDNSWEKKLENDNSDSLER